MKFTRSYLTAVIALVAFVSVARADVVSFGYAWQFGADPYHFYVSGSGVSNVTTSVSNAGGTLTINYGIGTATMTLPTAGVDSVTVGDWIPGTGTVIPFAHFSGTGIVHGDGLEEFFFSVQMPVALTITDLESGEFAQFHGTAELGGSIGSDFAILAAFPDFMDQSFLLDGKSYVMNNLTNSPMIFPLENNEPLTLGLEMFVTELRKVVEDGPGDLPLGPAEETPEPSSLLLGCGVASLWGLVAARRRRRRVVLEN